MPCSTSLARRSVSRLRAMPRSHAKSSKRRTPRNASRRMSRVHLSPMTFSVLAMEHVSSSLTSRCAAPCSCIGGTLAGQLQITTDSRSRGSAEGARLLGERLEQLVERLDERGDAFVLEDMTDIGQVD